MLKLYSAQKNEILSKKEVMMRKKICFIAQFPPPIHGLSKAVDTLYNSELNKQFEFEKIDITNNKKFIQTVCRILKSDADLFYFTISQSIGGNVRDLIILQLIALKKKKCIIHLHGGYFRKLVDNDMKSWQKHLNYRALGKVDGAIVLGRSLRYIFEGILPDDKIYVVPNCVDDEFLLSEEEFRDKMAGLKDRKIKHVLYLSNFIASKGYPYALELAKLEKERCENGGKKMLHFDFAGKFFEKSEEDFFFNYIKENHLQNYVTYHGIVSGEKKRELLKMSDIFILLTRYKIEGQPISILEAMGNGMTIITTDHAGIPDMVADGINGIIADETDIGNVYKQITEFRDYYNTAVINRETVCNNYSQKMYIDNMRKIFNR